MNQTDFKPAMSVYSDMYINEKNHWWYKALRDVLKYWIQKLKVKNALDVGCGTGSNLLLYKELNLKAYGVDVSDASLDYCRKNGLKDLKLGSVTDLPFQDESFELLTCLDVLGVLTNSELKMGVKELNRVLDSNGYLVINSAALPWMYSLHDKAWDIKQRFILKDFTKVLEQNGFSIIYATYRVSLLFPLILIFRFIEMKTSNSAEEARGNTHQTNFLLNFLFYKIMQLENIILRFVTFPVGNSIFVVAQKK